MLVSMLDNMEARTEASPEPNTDVANTSVQPAATNRVVAQEDNRLPDNAKISRASELNSKIGRQHQVTARDNKHLD